MVHTDVFAKDLNALTFATTVPHMLYESKFSDSVAFKRAYICPLAICHCVKERKMICEFEAADEQTIRTALTKIGLPTTAILAKAS
jgi:hypothetical protein